jgi:DNA-binding Lrp family transcriptional regulator
VSPITYRIYEIICDYLREDIHPTYREIAERCNMGTTSVLRHIDRLEGYGWIRREEAKVRSIRLGEKAPGLNPAPYREKKKKQRQDG